MSGGGEIGPRPRPCATCPYRRDVPSGVWDAAEYSKLPAYDEETAKQPPQLFMCHSGDSVTILCAGWLAVGLRRGLADHSRSLLALRLASFSSRRPLATEVWDYDTTVPLWSSGAEAAAWGQRDVAEPGAEAQAAMSKLIRQRDAAFPAPQE